MTSHKDYQRGYRRKNKDRINERQRTWRRLNPDKVKASNNRAASYRRAYQKKLQKKLRLILNEIKIFYFLWMSKSAL